MFNPFAIFNTVIAAPEAVAPALDDTAEMPRIVLHSRSITAEDTLLGCTGLIGRLVDYQPFDADTVWTLGHIRDIQMTRAGLRILVEPNENLAYSLLNKWRSLEQTELAWYDVEEK